MPTRHASVVVGIDIGGTSTNVSVVDATGRFLIEGLVEVPSRVLEGPGAALRATVEAFEHGIGHVGADASRVLSIGLGSPGPASANGVLSSLGSTNFSAPEWRGYDVRGALETRLGITVVYINDANAAALYAHEAHFGPLASRRSSVSAIIGTGLGGGVVIDGRVVAGAHGMGGELGHIRLALDGLLEPDQPLPICNCGQVGDAESIASLTAIANHLLAYWLGRDPRHELAGLDRRVAATRVRGLAERGDRLARAIFDQQAKALAGLFSIAANFVDPDAFFIGGGVIEASPSFRDWFVGRVRAATPLRDEQRAIEFAVVPDGDMAGARGAALAALRAPR